VRAPAIAAIMLLLMDATLHPGAADGTSSVALTDADCVRIGEARRIAAELGEELWPGWRSAPFGILLVTDDREFLVFHDTPGDHFIELGHDDRLGTRVFTRDRVFSPKLLATFPVDGPSTIVIGRPERTDASHSTRWTLTLLHEHFHQWQQSHPEYYPATGALGLADKDTTGMWMLNYPFPYDDKTVNDAFDSMCRRLADVVGGVDDKANRDLLVKYLSARERLRDTLAADDYAYFSFQLWQEGVARYTEYAIARKAAARYEATRAFKSLDDVVGFDEDARATRKHILTKLHSMSLKESRRTAFYHVGAAEAMLLDRENPEWRKRYFTDMFFLEKYYDAE
jgi:hypothetical protein